MFYGTKIIAQVSDDILPGLVNTTGDSIQSPIKQVYFKKNFDNNNKINSQRKLPRKHQNSVIGLKKIIENDKKNGVTFWERYCANTSIHGFKYIAEKELHWSERFTWIFLILSAIGCIFYVSFLLSRRFTSSPLATVIESRIFPVSEISFPAVTVCNYNRINWTRFEEVKNIFIPNVNDNSTIETFSTLIKALEILEFGSFEEFDVLANKSFIELEDINVLKLFENLVHNCDDIFVGPCWWRNKELPCCDIFTLQRSEYGLCYSFNSALNLSDVDRDSLIKNGTGKPLRTSSYGDWSGLRITVNTRPETRYPNSKHPSGFILIIHDPYQWPNSGQFIPSGTTTSIVIKPTYSYTTPSVHRLSPLQRQCVNTDEKGNDYMSLPGLKYLRANCISECRQRHTIAYCNCTPDFMFPKGNYTACNITGLCCLNKYDAILNFEKPPAGNIYFRDDEEGMECPCLPECLRIDYDIEFAPIVIKDSSQDLILMDFHFQYATMIKYRTDVTFGWLDLIVAFGGIAGLFLGCSILSCVEILYYLTFGFFIHSKIKPKIKSKFQSTISVRNLKRIKKKINVVSSNFHEEKKIIDCLPFEYIPSNI